MEFLDQIILDNSVRSYLVVATIILLVFLLKRFISHYLVSLLLALINKAWKVDKEKFKKLVVRPVSWLLVIAVSVVALDELVFPEAWNFQVYRSDTKSILNTLGVCAIIVAVVRFVLKMVDFIALIMKQRAAGIDHRNEYQMISFFRDFLKVVIGIFGVLWLIRSGLGKPVGPLLTGLSIVGAALALAAKESLENLIASFIIFFDKPFFVGDLLKVNTITGTVERIGLRSTRIRTGEKTLVTIPNKQMVDGIVDNMSMRTHRRAEIKLDFSPAAEAANLNQLISDIKEWLNQMKEEVHSVSAFLQDYNKNGVTLMVEYFTLPFDMQRFNEIRQEILLNIKKRVMELSLELQSSSTDIRIINNEEPQPPPANPII